MSQSSSANSTGSRRRAASLFIAGILVVTAALLAGWWLGLGGGRDSQPASGPAASKGAPQAPGVPAGPGSSAAPVSADKTTLARPENGPVAAATTTLRAAMNELRALMDDKKLDTDTRGTRVRALLARLRQNLREAPADAAAAAILQILDSGEDVTTGLGFTLAGGGVLDDAPSMRTTLLDMLGQLDPNGAVTYAQRIFNESRLADEWALSMRNLGWQNQDGTHTAELRKRVGELLDNQDWLARPTQGFLEAFDTAVHLGGVEELAGMASVMHLQDASGAPVENGTTHAAYLALDRLLQRHPEQSLDALAGDPQLLSWAPEHRAALMARADVSLPGQRAAIETYLRTLAQNPAELETFTSMFPNRNGLLGNALITTPVEQPTFQQLLEQDRAALAVVQGWMESGRYPDIEPSLRQISDRLTGFVRDAAAGRTTPAAEPRSGNGM